MTTFADKLLSLPSAGHLARLELIGADGDIRGVIANRPGQAGALAVYHALALRHGRVDATAATEGLELFAEHTEAARLHPGSHPNIDRLFAVIATGQVLTVRLIPA
ncbi:MAG: DUF2322 family protein [Limnohabitans sp.]